MSSLATVNPLASVAPLAEQAIRLRRTRWRPEMIQALADELYLILSQDQAAAAGPTSVAPGGGTVPLSLPPFFPLGPLGDFQFPDFLLDQPYPTPLSQDISNADPLGHPDNPPRPGRDGSQSRVYVQRAVVPGLIQSGGPAAYAVTIYPNGQGGVGLDGNPLSKSVTATQLQTDGVTPIPAGTWAWVFCCFTYEVKTVIVATGAYSASRGPGANQAQTEINVLSRTFQMIVPTWLNG